MFFLHKNYLRYLFYIFPNPPRFLKIFFIFLYQNPQFYSLFFPTFFFLYLHNFKEKHPVFKFL